MDLPTTDLFRLEHVQEKHFEPLKQYALEENLWIYSTVKIKSEEDFKDYFNQALVLSNETSQRAFAVYDITREEYIGMTRLYAFDSKNKAAKLGFTWYAPALQGKGVNLHVKYLILKYAFDYLGLERIELNADLRNERSIAAMLKIGATQEGVLRKNVYLPDGHKRDTVIFGILNEDWNTTIKELLTAKLAG